MERNTGEEYIIITLEENIKVNGSMIKKMDMVPFNMLVEIVMRAIGRMDKDLKMDFINIQMEMSMMENGAMI
jgi:hypothetical protein